MKAVAQFATLLALVFGVGAAQAGVIDLTSVGATETYNDAIFVQVDPQSTGTGVINAFVQIQANGVEEGYNSDYRPVEYDEKNSPNHSLLLAEVPVVDIDGVAYREFLLDINETKPKSLISLDAIEIYLGGSGNLTGHGSGFAGATKIFDLDTGPDGDGYILLDYNLGSGSGSGDMLAFIPDNLFDSDAYGEYVYLYSKFGAEEDADAGFEEWAVRKGTTPPVVPAPGAALLSSLGLGLVGWLRRSRSL